MSPRYSLFGLAFEALALTGADKALRPWAQGVGAILTVHRVRPWAARDFAPNRLLEITPEFLDQAITRARQAGFLFVDLDEALVRLKGAGTHRFIALTFDDGYRDTLEHALPILQHHGVPATVFVTTGFAERTAPLWWVDLERAVAAAEAIEVDLGEGMRRMPAGTAAEKRDAFRLLYGDLRSGPEERLREIVAGLAERHGVDSVAVADELCLDWDGILKLAESPLVTIGAHTLTHPMLAKQDVFTVCRELDESRRIIAARIERAVRHVSYPVGDPASAGPREFELARELGFHAGVTTRPGMLFPDHAHHPTALPRLSLNGHFQNLRQLDALLAGLPSLLWNRGRRLSLA